MSKIITTLGNRKNPPLVFLHGFLGSGRIWQDIAPSFCADYFCVLPDLPGHGENTTSDLASPLNFDILAEWLARLLDEIPAPNTHLVGYSLGGRAALKFASRYPERILTLTLESAGPGIPNQSERAHRLAEDSARAETILNDGMSAFVESWYRMPLFSSLSNHPQKLAALKESASRNDPRWMAKIVRELSPGTQTPLWDSLSNIPFPVLLIAGEKDEKYVEVIHRMAEKIPDSRPAIVAEAGHNVHVEHPEDYITLLRKFLFKNTPLVE